MCHRSCGFFSLSVCDSHLLCLPNNDFFLFFSFLFLLLLFFFRKEKSSKEKEKRKIFFGSFIIIHKILIDVLLFFFVLFVALFYFACVPVRIYPYTTMRLFWWEMRRTKKQNLNSFILKDFFLLWSNNKCFFCVWYTWENGRLLKYIRMRDTFTSYVFFRLSFSL